ncbi:phosphomannomutase/phosphoglucomutase [Agromyces sp. NPDC049794]|uniref:phosphomannomutase/phosphoglucomutase n=1 Tax=unclassified Agromyces TaxID=2639701 RepID=UPI00340747AC
MDLSHLVKAYDIRGIVPDELDPTVAHALGAAFARVVVHPEAGSAPADAAEQTTVVVGHDMRASGPGLARAFVEGLTDAGIDVVQIGLCSTDGLYHASGALGLPGAMFTASHNPAQYNGIKLCRAGARPVGEDTGLADIRSMAGAFLRDGLPEPAARRGTIAETDLLADYARFLRGLVDLSGIRPLKVVIDAGNGMAGHTAPAVLGTAAGLPSLPLEIVPLYFELDGEFPNHEPNPLDPENLRDLQSAVVEHRADLGIAFDGDADRCFVVDGDGAPVSPSAITTLVGRRVVAAELRAGRVPTVIHNAITSRAVPELLGAAGARTVRTRVAHSFIKARMSQHDAVFGGEHSAHYYFRDFFFADTGMLAAMHVLAELGGGDRSLADLVCPDDPYAASGEINSRVADVSAARDRVLAAFLSPERDAPADLDELDGLTLSRWDSAPKWWFNLRASNTEPLLRLNVEATDRPTMERIRDEVLSLVQERDR